MNGRIQKVLQQLNEAVAVMIKEQKDNYKAFGLFAKKKFGGPAEFLRAQTNTMKRVLDQFKREDPSNVILQKLYDQTNAGLKKAIIGAKKREEFKIRNEMTVEELI